MVTKRKLISLLLAFAIVFNFFVPITMPAQAAKSDADMDALGALGIDSTLAPEGYDPDTTDNPYGRDVVQLAPVQELYTVGLGKTDKEDADYTQWTYSAGTGFANGEKTAERDDNGYANTLTTKLYGHKREDLTTAQDILKAPISKVLLSGTTKKNLSYKLISSGTVTNDSNGEKKGKVTGYYHDILSKTTDFENGFEFALSNVASGNFNENKMGQSAQIAMVYTAKQDNSGGLYLRFGDAVTGEYGTDAKELISKDKKIGNPELEYEGKKVENFAQSPYQLQNYLQVATGDWNGDGIDEVAVYIPEKGNSRIVVFALQLTGADDRDTAYLDPSKWSVVWTYPLNEGDVVSNMVSLVSGDVNRDGVDDLAATWGYYYGPEQNKGSKAVVMFGGKGTNMLKASQQFDLTYGTSNIVRGSFAFGDMSGGNENEKVLILCGQSDADLRAGNVNTRYVALYSWDGTKFETNIDQNFDLFAKEKNDDGSYTYAWPVMTRFNDEFLSVPLCVSNTAILAQPIGQGGDLLYFDSLVIEYAQDGLKIKQTWDIDQQTMQMGSALAEQYVEYGAVAGDMTGQNGAGTMVTMTQRLCTVAERSAGYTYNGTVEVPNWVKKTYYANWFNKLFGIKSYRYVQEGTSQVTTSDPITVDYTAAIAGATRLVAVSHDGTAQKVMEVDASTAITLANTDNDSSFMKYGNKHYFTYTDPKVLTVLASPPYFADLLDRDDLSGNYAESTTSYASSKGSGSGFTAAATITLGAYIGFEQEVSVFGVKIAEIEAETTFTSEFTFETEHTSTLEQTITYTAASGEDMVAFYSIPMEIYEYTTFVPDGKGGYTEVLSTVNIPHEAAVRLLSLEEYELIAKDYSVLDRVEDNALTHTLGDPTTYPTSTAGYKVVAAYDGDPSAVGFSSAGGGSAIAQEIAMSSEKENAFSAEVGVETKVGGGAGGMKAGIIAGASAGAGLVFITTSGSTFSGEMQNMPIEAQPFGYGMNWKIFCYEYNNGKIAFPVVNYLVSDVSKPPALPEDFGQNVAETTAESITLEWSYDKLIAGFKILRYFEFPDGTGSDEIAYIPFAAGEKEGDTYHFTFTDEGLSPYTDYSYQIQAVRGAQPAISIYSEPMSCRTKTLVGYPDITLAGLDRDGVLPIYPDAEAVVTATVAEVNKYKSVNYQWQKYKNGAWENLAGQTAQKMTIENASAADDNQYRCRLNVLYYDTDTASQYYISAYSAAFSTAYAKRSLNGKVTADSKSEVVQGGAVNNVVAADIKLYSTSDNHTAAPTGTVTFTVTGTDYAYSGSVQLDPTAGQEQIGGLTRNYSTASLKTPALADGVYTVTAYYSGSRVFKDRLFDEGVLVVVGNGTAHELTLATDDSTAPATSFVYGESINPTLYLIENVGGEITKSEVTGVTYRYYLKDGLGWEIFKDNTKGIGSYLVTAEKDGLIVATASFTVTQRPIVLRVENQEDIAVGTVSQNLPVITGEGLTPAELSALNLTYEAYNSAGNKVENFGDTTDPGNYTMCVATTTATPLALYSNYSITSYGGSYTIIGATHKLSVEAQDYTDRAGTRPVGTVGISNASNNATTGYYATGEQVVLFANAFNGYEVDTWTVTFANNTTQTQTGGNRYTLTTQAQAVEVTVSFKPKNITLNAIVQPNGNPSEIICDDEYFSSGATVSYGAEYVFTAIPAEGYHFDHWTMTSGANSTTPAGGVDARGRHTLAVTVGYDTANVYAFFERDEYVLTLQGDIEGYYEYQKNGETLTRNISSGEKISGDTEVFLTVKSGYAPAEDAVYVVNGEDTTFDEDYSLIITENTTVALETERGSYAVTTQADNGSIQVKLNGHSVQDLSAVDGGSRLKFTAYADRGYVFDYWEVNGETQTGPDGTLTIEQLALETEVVAVFKANNAYTANAAVSDASRGSINYTLCDIYGEPVFEDVVMPTGGITVYEGESITLKVKLNGGSMVEQWLINGTNVFTGVKTQTIASIDDDVTVTAYIKASSQYEVNFIAMGTDGSLSASSSGSLSSGDLQDGGSEIIFSAQPDSDYMVDYWTVTSGKLATPETSEKVLDESGNVLVDPIYVIDGLRQNCTVRVYFTAEQFHDVDVDVTADDCTADITYVTPIDPSDDGTCSDTSAQVRDGGIVRMELSAGDSSTFSEQKLKAAVPTGVTVSVSKQGETYYVTLANVTEDIELTDDDLFVTAYPVTVPSGVTAMPQRAAAGETVTLTVTPPSGKELDTLTVADATLNETVDADRLTYTFTMPSENVNVSVTFKNSNTGGGGTGGGGAGGGEQAKDESVAVINGKATSLSVKEKNGIATIDANERDIKKALSEQAHNTLDFTDMPNVTGVTLPSGALEGTQKNDTLTLVTNTAQLTLDAQTLATISAAGSGEVTIRADKVDQNSLTPEQKQLVQNRPVLDFTITVGGKTVSDFNGGLVNVTIPYTLKTGESADCIAVWYLDSKGVMIPINATYDAASGTVNFATNHFSKYVVGSLPFGDVTKDAWYYEAVSYAYANSLFSGVQENAFAPDMAMTRAMLVTVLWHIDGESAAPASTFTDVAQDAWYAKAAAWAAQQGIVSGYGDGRFGADDKITREQLAAILMQYTKLKGHDIAAGETLEKFSDASAVSTWAKGAMQWASARKLVSGMGNGTLAPQGEATRAQVAAVLQQLMQGVMN